MEALLGDCLVPDVSTPRTQKRPAQTSDCFRPPKLARHLDTNGFPQSQSVPFPFRNTVAGPSQPTSAPTLPATHTSGPKQFGGWSSAKCSTASSMPVSLGLEERRALMLEMATSASNRGRGAVKSTTTEVRREGEACGWRPLEERRALMLQFAGSTAVTRGTNAASSAPATAASGLQASASSTSSALCASNALAVPGLSLFPLFSSIPGRTAEGKTPLQEQTNAPTLLSFPPSSGPMPPLLAPGLAAWLASAHALPTASSSSSSRASELSLVGRTPVETPAKTSGVQSRRKVRGSVGRVSQEAKTVEAPVLDLLTKVGEDFRSWERKLGERNTSDGVPADSLRSDAEREVPTVEERAGNPTLSIKLC